MKSSVVCVFAFLLAAPVFAAFEDKLVSAQETYLGGAYTAHTGAGDSLARNPASLAYKKSGMLSFSQAELFALPDLKADSIECIVPLRGFGGAQAGYSQFGPSMYREKEITLSCGVKAADELAAGLAIANKGLRIAGYGSAQAFSVDAGAIALLADIFSCGFYCRNVIAQGLGAGGEKPQKSFRFGLGFQPGEGFITLVDLERNFIDRKIIYHFGQEIGIGRFLNLGFGWESVPARLSAGVGIKSRFLRMEYAFITHPYLDIEHHVSVHFVVAGMGRHE